MRIYVTIFALAEHEIIKPKLIQLQMGEGRSSCGGRRDASMMLVKQIISPVRGVCCCKTKRESLPPKAVYLAWLVVVVVDDFHFAREERGRGGCCMQLAAKLCGP